MGAVPHLQEAVLAQANVNIHSLDALNIRLEISNDYNKYPGS